jgi:hypothetical protein
MWISLLVLAAAQAADNGPLNNYAKFVVAHPRVAIKLSLSVGAGKTIPADIKFDRDHALRIDSKGPTHDYTYVVSSRGEREIERTTREYDENLGARRPYTFESRLNAQFSLLLPPVLLATDMHQMASPKNPFVFKGSKAGVSTYSYDQVVQEGTKTVVVELRPDGALVGVRITVQSPGGGISRNLYWGLSNYQDLPASSLASAYTLEIPDGFVPFGLPQPTSPAQKRFKTSLRPKANTLVVLADPSAPFANALTASINRISRSGVPVKWLGKSDQKLAAELNSSLLPYIVLVQPNGTILKNWLGFDSDNAKSFEADVLATSRGSSQR